MLSCDSALSVFLGRRGLVVSIIIGMLDDVNIAPTRRRLQGI